MTTLIQPIIPWSSSQSIQSTFTIAGTASPPGSFMGTSIRRTETVRSSHASHGSLRRTRTKRESQEWIVKRIERGNKVNTREKCNSHEPYIVLANINSVITAKKQVFKDQESDFESTAARAVMKLTKRQRLVDGRPNLSIEEVRGGWVRIRRVPALGGF